MRFPGGGLEVERLETGEVLLTGPAERVFEGTVDLDRLRGRAARDGAIDGSEPG